MAMNMQLPDDARLSDWLAKLVRIPSVSPDQAGPRAGQAGEAAIAQAVVDWFTQLGGQVHWQEVHPGRHNVIGFWQGRTDRLAGLDVHMDTVGVEEMQGDPFSGHIDGGRVFGRGACDTKASLAIALALLEQYHQQKHQPDASLMIAATVDEEVGATGAPALASWLRERKIVVDQMAVAEPTLCSPVVGHKGVVRVELSIQGKAAHSSQPELGQNAIHAAAKIITAIETENARLTGVTTSQETSHPLGPGTMAVTLIQGGRGANIIAPSCTLCIDRRLTAGESPQEVAAAITKLATAASDLPVESRTLVAVGPFAQDASDAWITNLQKWSGSAASVAGYCTNAWAYPRDVARACVVIGPGSIDQAHGKVEWVSIDELSRMASIMHKWWENAT